MFAFSPDDSKITFLFSQDRTLSQQLFTFDPATGQQRLVAQLQNREGVTLYGALYHPPQAGDGPLPLIVSVYGGPHAQLVVNRWGMAASMRAQYLSQQGFLVFVMDNRGSARRGVAFERPIKHNLGDVEVQDQVDGVRLVWLDDDTTATLKVVNLDGSGNYNATINIPGTLSPGSEKVCAAVTGTPQAAFQCVNITVNAPNPGSVTGTIPLTSQANQAPSGAVNASLNLYDQQGNVIAGAPIQSNGSYTLNNLPPGTYTAGVTGSVPVLVQNGSVVVQSGQQATFNPAPYSQCTKGSVVAVRLTPTGKATSSFDFGSYVNYWPYTEAGPKIVFQVDMQVLNGASWG